jgi:hypothetical protein
MASDSNYEALVDRVLAQNPSFNTDASSVVRSFRRVQRNGETYNVTMA